MVSVRSKRCWHDSSTSVSSYSFEGDKPAYCKQHAEGGMVNVRSKRCTRDSCTTLPTYNFTGAKAATYCKQHAMDGMVNVFSRPSSKSHTSRRGGRRVPTLCVQLKMEIVDSPVSDCGKRSRGGVDGKQPTANVEQAGSKGGSRSSPSLISSTHPDDNGSDDEMPTKRTRYQQRRRQVPPLEVTI